MRSSVTAFVTFVALSTTPGFAADPDPDIRTYIVQPGDSAWSVAEEFYGSGSKYPIIYKYNGFSGAPPFLLKAGQVLRLPVLDRLPEAQVAWLMRDVKAKPPRALDWLTARERMNLWRLYRVSTGDESAAHIVFEDASDLRLRENALLVIYGGSATAARADRRDKREVVLEQGTIQGGLAKLDEKASPLVVKTPSGEVDVLGRLTQIQAEALASMVSVFEGKASVRAQGAKVDVAEGEGTVVEKGKKPEPARPLPRAPGWKVADARALVPVVAGQRGTWEAAWEPVPEAATYRVELATDATFKQVLFDAEVGAGVTKLRLADLAPGGYAVRVGTRDASRLESKPGVVKAIDVVSIAASRRLDPAPDGTFEAVGFLQVEIAELAGQGFDRKSLRVAIDEGPDQAGNEPVVLYAPGLHTIRFSSDGAVGALKVRILGVRGTWARSDAIVARGGGAQEPAEAELVVADERGRPALIPGLVVETSTGQALPLEAAGDAKYRVRVGPVPEDGPLRLAVRARWLGGELATHELRVEQPRPQPVAKRVRIPTAVVPYRSGRAQSKPLGTPQPESRLALDGVLLDEDPGAGLLGLVLAGELAIGESVALDADLLFADVRLEEGREGPQARFGDLAVGARWAAVRDETLALAPHVRVGLPIGPRAGPRLFGLEPGVGLRWTPSGRLFVDVAAGVVYASDFGGADLARLSGTLSVSWRILDILSLSVSGQAQARLDESFVATVLGLGAALDLGPARIGLAVGAGLGDDARAGYGAWLGRAMCEIGF